MGDALHLEAQRRLGAGDDRAPGDLHVAVERLALVDLAHLVELDVERLGDGVDGTAPGVGQDAGQEQQRLGVERLAEAHGVEQHLGLVVGRVVEDLHDPDAADPLAHAGEQDRQEVVGEAGIDAVEEAAGAALLAGRLQRLDQRRIGRRRVEELHERARHHVGSARQDAGDVGHRLGRARSAVAV